MSWELHAIVTRKEGQVIQESERKGRRSDVTEALQGGAGSISLEGIGGRARSVWAMCW